MLGFRAATAQTWRQASVSSFAPSPRPPPTTPPATPRHRGLPPRAALDGCRGRAHDPLLVPALLLQAVRCMYIHACKTSAFRDGVAHSCKAHIAHPGIQVGDRLCQSIDAMEKSIESRLTGVGKGGMTPGADPVL